MHIPPYHKKEKWQLIIIGICFGGVIAYCVFLYMYGVMYERMLAQNLTLQSKVSELQSSNESLLEDQQDLDERVNEPQTIEKIQITIENHEQMKFDRLITHQLEDLVREEISYIIGKPIATIDESNELLISTIENKAFTVDDFTYYFDVYKLTISGTVRLTVKAKFSSS